MKRFLCEFGCDKFTVLRPTGAKHTSLFLKKDRGYGGKGKTFFLVKKKFFPFPHISFLYQIIYCFCCAEAAEDGGDEADGADFAVGEAFQWGFGGIDGFHAFGYAEVAETFTDDAGEGAAVGFGNICQFNL